VIEEVLRVTKLFGSIMFIQYYMVLF